jgi:hypothetical protein
MKMIRNYKLKGNDIVNAELTRFPTQRRLAIPDNFVEQIKEAFENFKEPMIGTMPQYRNDTAAPLAVHQPAGSGDLAAIGLAADCHAVEISNLSAATLTVRLRAAAITIPPHSSRRLRGAPGLSLADVADTLLISASAEVPAGRLVVIELRKEGE